MSSKEVQGSQPFNQLKVSIWRAEYEHTPITKEDLIEKYKIPSSVDMSHWNKQGITILPPTNTAPSKPPQEPDTDSLTDDDIKLKLTKAKGMLATKLATHVEQLDLDELTPKDIKEMSSAIATLEGSLKATQGPAINIFVQQLTQKFADARDC